MKLKNLEALIGGRGDLAIGRIGRIRCAATASGDGMTLAMLVRRPRESLEELLTRLDAAVGLAWEHDEFTDEING